MTATQTSGLFDASFSAPLAERMRPKRLEDVVGQSRLLAGDAPLRRAIEAGKPYSMILWGPPGCGKTSLARMLAEYAKFPFRALSAVMSGLPEVRKALTEATARAPAEGPTVLFIDEVHRFNKLQQDAFLPYIEQGTVIFIGATTENPSFELNSALLSRCRVHVLEPLDVEAIMLALRRALELPAGLALRGLSVDEDALRALAEAADGDVRRGLTLLEIAAEQDGEGGHISLQALAPVLTDKTRRFDKGGEQFHDQISALHKCVRSSNPDAALYWLVRMLDGGCAPAYLARRITRMAVEDIGLADPRALSMAMQAWEAYDRIGSPEGELALAQAVLYLASTAKSNAVYLAYKAAQADVRDGGSDPVPMHLRNAPTRLMKSLGYGAGYVYDHDLEDGVALQQSGFPERLGERLYYQPTSRGLELKLKEKLDRLRSQRAALPRGSG